MKNALNNIALKILAVILSFIMFFSMLISFFAVGVMLFNDFYTSDFKSCETPSRLNNSLAAAPILSANIQNKS